MTKSTPFLKQECYRNALCVFFIIERRPVLWTCEIHGRRLNPKKTKIWRSRSKKQWLEIWEIKRTKTRCSSKYSFFSCLSIFTIFRHFDHVDKTHLDATNWYIWLWGPCLVNQLIKYDKLICIRTVDFHRISARKSILQGKNENIQGKCIPSACESVYREIFVPYRETLRLPSNPWGLRGLSRCPVYDF